MFGDPLVQTCHFGTSAAYERFGSAISMGRPDVLLFELAEPEAIHEC